MTRFPQTASSPSRRQFLAWSGGLTAAGALAAAGCSAPGDGAGAAKAAGVAAGSSSDPKALTRIGLDYPFTQLPLYSTLVKLSTTAAKMQHLSLLTTSDAGNADTQATNLGAQSALLSAVHEAAVSSPVGSDRDEPASAGPARCEPIPTPTSPKGTA
ncbi:twin-arginine translocation signal domain-containing protein [Streptomyces longisporus]